MMMNLVLLFLTVATLPQADGCLASYNPDIIPTTRPTTSILTTTTTSLNCMLGWSFYEGSGFCYFLGTNMMMTVEQTRAACQAEGADLASIHSQAENDFVISLAAAGQPARGILLGVMRTGTGNTNADFGNYDGTPVTFSYHLDSFQVDYSNWGTTEPNDPTGMCVWMASDVILPDMDIMRGQWFDVPCQASYLYYICKALPM